MSVIENAVAWARGIAADNSHGYDQANRWGADYDCSSFVISAYKAAGIPLGCTYTGNMKADMLSKGFSDVTGSVNRSTGAGLQQGDVLLHERNHTAMYIGNGMIVQASINEKGTVTGGQSGDQTGKEIAERSYYNYPWDCVLRYSAEAEDKPDASSSDASIYMYTVQLPLLKYGATGGYVRTAQRLLIAAGISCGSSGADGDMGSNTVNAVKKFQQLYGLLDDGEIGGETWAELLKN